MLKINYFTILETKTSGKAIYLALDLLCLVERGWMMALYLSKQMATRVHVDTFT